MSDIKVPENLKKPEVELVGQDGNAYHILAQTRKALMRAGNDKSIIDSYIEQATSGQYNHLLAVTMEFADVV